tara:strand:- start:2645 stop:3949 length:1305 start_codon:yes stop_codon:yes gene_type:complete
MNKEFEKIKKIIAREKEAVKEIDILLKDLAGDPGPSEKRVATNQIASLKKYLSKTNNSLGEELKSLSLAKKVPKHTPVKEAVKPVEEDHEEEVKFKGKADHKEFELSELEKLTLKRLKKKEKKKKEKKIKHPSLYVKFSNKVFSETATKLIQEPFFNRTRRDIIKSNLEILPRSYLSMMLMTSLLAFVASIFLIIFFLFFSFGIEIPFITLASESIWSRLVKTFWMLIVFPLASFALLYLYPGLERKSDENKINQELPFATIHMSAVSGSMIDPTKIFSILVSTGDYPNISKQFVKLLNQINLQGSSLVNSLRSTAFNSPSEKLSDLMGGLATTITSGGDLPDFFEKRAQSLMLDYRLEKEKYAKTAETFMDIYISVVIAAPMILMLLLIMMNVSGLGGGVSAGTISLIMVLGVSVINFGFLVFLHVRGATKSS